MLRKKSLYSLISVFIAVLMIVLSALSPVGALSGTITNNDTAQKPVTNISDKIDSVLKEKMAEASPEEKIPVAIWFSDIDKEELETEVEKTCGISKRDITITQTNTIEDTQLYQAIDSKNATVLRNYVNDRIDASAEQRAMKKLYNSTLRSVASEIYTAHNESIVSSADISTEDIIFLSKLTPFMIAEVESSKITELSNNENILNMGYYNDNIVSLPSSSASDENYTENMAAMNLDKAVEKYGLTGAGVTVLMIDADYVRSDHNNYYKVLYPENIRVIYNQNEDLTTNTAILPDKAYPDDNHANHVVGALQSVASDAFIYSVKIRMYGDIEWAIENRNIDIINASISHSTDTYDNSYVAQWFDALVNAYGIALIASAGNDSVNDSRVVSPASGYNSIAIGVHNSQTGKMRNYRYNPIDDPNYVSYKPDIVAAANYTSTGAPYITAIVTMMIEMNSDIASNPELVKAILMASCHSKALPFDSSTEIQENMFDGLTMKQGAGKVDAYKVLSIVLMETYDTGTIFYGSQNVNTLSIPYDTNVNVSLVWFKDNIFPFGLGPGTPDSFNTVSATAQELTLSIANDGEFLKNSSVTNSGKQLLYFSSEADIQYDIHITKTSNNSTPVTYAYAWSTSFQKELESVQINGKIATNQQLSVIAQCNDETTASVNNLNYQWQSSSDGINWTDIGGAISATYTLTNQDFLKYICCKITPKMTSAILPFEAVAISDKKVIVYGDSNLNGLVNTKDATAVQKYLAGTIDLSEDQKRAADVDGDGDVDINDATLIQKYVASQITIFPVEQ